MPHAWSHSHGSLKLVCYAHFTEEDKKLRQLSHLPESTQSHEGAQARTWLGLFNCKAPALEERKRRLGKDREERTNEKRKQVGFNEQIALDSPD